MPANALPGQYVSISARIAYVKRSSLTQYDCWLLIASPATIPLIDAAVQNCRISTYSHDCIITHRCLGYRFFKPGSGKVVVVTT
jgi:hypothetical protein